jgi:hypothetical protein
MVVHMHPGPRSFLLQSAHEILVPIPEREFVGNRSKEEITGNRTCKNKRPQHPTWHAISSSKNLDQGNLNLFLLGSLSMDFSKFQENGVPKGMISISCLTI